MSELSNLLDLCGSSSESREDSSNVSARLHRDDSELILLIDPDEESLLIVVENSSTLWPVSVETTSVKEPVSFLEEEVIVNQLLLLCWSHGSKRVESASKLTFE